MEEKELLNEIYNNLQNGCVYGEYIYDTFTGKNTLFWSVLCLVKNNNNKELIYGRHYGSSYYKNTKKDLEWLLDNIFKLKPSEFLNKYIIDR